VIEMEKFPLTKQGFLALEEELKNLKGVERPNIIAAIAEARSHGDLSENAEYSAAKEKQSFIEGRIQDLEAVLSRAQVIDVSGTKSDVIRFGATVLVADEDTDDEKRYQIVGDYEADIEKNKISLSSPLAKALIGKEVGDTAEYVAPGGKKSFEILEIKYI
jgi:transcription elongation factor greA